ncbi:hypothetical protein [Streptomyces sp.]|uniref:hypothetical protein n=1 Tax=Streptomyces sp. TaxID=1931 RepID=UPI002812558F|nr:hypothetical protein [Streptomyces sp.]
MYGHGATPPARSAATVITLRVLFVAAGFLSCGLLACVPLFRIAFLRGRILDWTLAWASIPASITCLAVVGSLPETDPRTDVALAAVLILGAAAGAYFLTVDIRLHRQPHPYAVQAPPSPHATTTHPPGVHSPYGYPQPASPYAPTPAPQPPAPHAPAPHIPAPHIPAPHTPVPPPQSQPPQRPAPARIDQVRAELDELSDYLRRQDGQHGQHGGHEGGR